MVAGGTNTFLTFAVYQLLLFVLDSRLAYASAWLAGLVFVAIVYPSKVFGVSSERGRAGL
ncbi:MAG: hypothetical protein INR68_17750, partial [Methylobacterium mesophilicum]|nr:hypothetical protein [Methylobacterium mesophilicum]